MSPLKRAFPTVVWLAAFLLLLLVYVPGLWLLHLESVPAASFMDLSLLLDINSLGLLMPRLEEALHITLLCLALGYPAGILLSLFKRRIAIVCCLMPFFFLGGTALLFGQRLISLYPKWFVPILPTVVNGTVSPFAAMSIILLPLMIIGTCSFTSAIDPALVKAARGLGASRLRAFLTLTFPRTLVGALAGSVLVFASALSLSVISRQEGITFGLALTLSAALLFLTLIVITVCLLAQKNSRRAAPC